MMNTVSLVSDIAWVKRGVARKVPHKVKLDPNELKDLIKSENAILEESDQSDVDVAMAEEADEQEGSKLRGSGTETEVATEEAKNAEDIEKRHIKMTGMAMFASPLEDPYITSLVDSDAEEDKEDYEIKPDDNLLVYAKIDKDEYTIEVKVYNEKDGDFYVHHDYILDAPPLCLEHFFYDPGVEDRKGNLLGVGTMDSVVNIWDLDIVNAVEPVVSLGSQKGKRRKRDGTAQGHSDAVLCLSWNRNTKHVLASGSADKSVVLWDLDDVKAATIFPGYSGKIQALEWHPAENSILLSGTISGQIDLRDCRQSGDSVTKQWKVEGEVEHVLWDHFNPFYFFAATDSGKLYYFDSRSTEPKFVTTPHESGTRGISQSCAFKGLCCTCGADEIMKVWKLDTSGFHMMHSQNPGLGELQSVCFSPDSGDVLAVGGSAGEFVRIISLEKVEGVKSF